ncbi:MAG: SDR family NAD(P)-dependent oxidoreductase, partial [Pseudomonadota bacterium]
MAGQELAGTVAIITGGTRGLGRACAGKFVGAGAQVVITGLDPARGAAAAKSIGSSAHFVKQDVSQAADW